MTCTRDSLEKSAAIRCHLAQLSADEGSIRIDSGHREAEENPDFFATAVRELLSRSRSVDRYCRQELAAGIRNFKDFSTEANAFERRPWQLGAEESIRDRIADIGEQDPVSIEQNVFAFSDIEV